MKKQIMYLKIFAALTLFAYSPITMAGDLKSLATLEMTGASMPISSTLKYVKSVVIQANGANSGNVKIGDINVASSATGRGIALAPGASFSDDQAPIDLTTLYVVGTASDSGHVVYRVH